MKSLSAQFSASRGDGSCVGSTAAAAADALYENSTEAGSKRSSALANGRAPATGAASPITDQSHNSPKPRSVEQRPTIRVISSAGASPSACRPSTSISEQLPKRASSQADSDGFANIDTAPFVSYSRGHPKGIDDFVGGNDDVVYCASSRHLGQAKRRRVNDVEHNHAGRVSAGSMAPFSEGSMKDPGASAVSSSEPKHRPHADVQRFQWTGRAERDARRRGAAPSNPDPRLGSPSYSDGQTPEPVGNDSRPPAILSTVTERGADAVTQDGPGLTHLGTDEGDGNVEDANRQLTTDGLRTVEAYPDEQLPSVRGSSPVASGSRNVRFPRSRLITEQLKPKRQANIEPFFSLLVDGGLALVESDGDPSSPGFFVVTMSKIRVVSVRGNDDTVDEVSLDTASRTHF